MSPSGGHGEDLEEDEKDENYSYNCYRAEIADTWVP
jgi:hypothetical protein